MSCDTCVSSGEKAINLVMALARVTKAALVGDTVFVTTEERKARLAVCVVCEHFQPATSTTQPTCGLCGCVVKLKAWMATEDCPADKWTKIVEEKV